MQVKSPDPTTQSLPATTFTIAVADLAGGEPLTLVSETETDWVLEDTYEWMTGCTADSVDLTCLMLLDAELEVGTVMTNRAVPVLEAGGDACPVPPEEALSLS